MEPQTVNKKWNLFDVFISVIVLLAVAAVYFTFVQPIKFSHMIEREEIPRYAEVLLSLPADYVWAKTVLPSDLEKKDIYGRTEWKILSFEEMTYEGVKWPMVRIKVKVSQPEQGPLHHGNYVISRGQRLSLNYQDYLIEGRIYEFRILEEKISL